MSSTHLHKLLLYSVLWVLQCSVVYAASIIPITLPKDLPVSTTNSYTLDLDREVTTPNGNILNQNHALYFDMGVQVNAIDTRFIRLTLTEEVRWGIDDLVLLFEEGNQPNLAGNTQDLNGNGVLEVLEVGFLNERQGQPNNALNQTVVVFSLRVPNNLSSNARLLLAIGEPDYSITNGRVTNTAAHPIISVVDTSKPARITFSVHDTETNANDGTNALFTDPDVLLINFTQQFDFNITQAATSVIDSTTTPTNRLFVEEGSTLDALTSNNDTDINLSAAQYSFVNNRNLIEDPINIDADDFLLLGVVGNMGTVSNVFIELDDSGLDTAGTRTALTISPEVASVQIQGNQFPTTSRTDHIAIQVQGEQPLQPINYAVNAQIGITPNGSTTSTIVLDKLIPNVFIFSEQPQIPIFRSQPLPNQQIDMVSDIGVSTSNQIVFTNQGNAPLSIQLLSQPQSDIRFTGSYINQLDAGRTDVFPIQCIPSSETSTQLNVQFATSDPNFPLVTYPIQCRTIPEPPPIDPTTPPPTQQPNDPSPTAPVITPISNGSTVTGTTTNFGNVATDIKIQPNGSITGGRLAGEIDNQGLIANLTIDPETTVQGGKFSATVNNNGTVCDATITIYSELIGGNVCNNIQNFGELTDVNVLEQSKVTGGTLNNVIFNQGTMCDIELGDNARLVGGKIDCNLTGQRRAPATIAQAEVLDNSQLSNVCITPSVTFAEGVELSGNIQLPKNYDYPDMQDYCIQPEQIQSYAGRDLLGIDPEALSIFQDADLKNLSADAMQAATPDHMSNIPEKTLDAMTQEQFDVIPLDSFFGLTQDNMSGLKGNLIGAITTEHVSAMNPESIEQLNAWGRTKYLTNFDPELVPLETAKTFLREGWSMDDNGLITVPADTPINFASFQLPESFPQQVSIDYDFPNFSKGFGLGGRGTPIVNEMNAALEQSNNPQGIQRIEQSEDGLIVMTERNGQQRSYIPDFEGLIQLGDDAPVGIKIDEETGKLLVITTAKQQLTFLPAPKDYFLLGDILGQNSKARCYDKGDVLLEIERNGQMQRVVVTFAPDVDNDSSEAGVYLSDENTSFTRQRQVRAPIREGRVVFSDGTAQRIYPSVLFPNTFIELTSKVEGVNSVALNVDGTFNLTFRGTAFVLKPTFDTTSTSLDAGQRIAPSISMNNTGNIVYKVQEENLLVETQLVITRI